MGVATMRGRTARQSRIRGRARGQSAALSGV
jgi:hypothetical protein